MKCLFQVLILSAIIMLIIPSILLGQTQSIEGIKPVDFGSSKNLNTTFKSNAYTYPDEMIRYVWKGNDTGWYNDTKWLISTDEFDRPIDQTSQEWVDSLSDWHNSGRNDYYYSLPGLNPDSTCYSNWNISYWQLTMKQECIYDQDYKMIRVNIYDRDGYHWEHIQKTEIYYDAEGNPFQELHQYYLGGSWFYTMRTTYIYEEGRLIETTYSTAVGMGGWDYYLRILYDYDQDGNNVETIVQSYSGEEWENVERHSVNFESGLISYWEIFCWKNNIWSDSEYTSREYNEFDNPIRQTTQIYTDGEWINKSMYEYFYDSQTDIVVHNPDILPESDMLLQNYPNPFNPTSTIEFALSSKAHTRLTIYNLLGQLVDILVDKPLSAGHYEVEFNGAELPSGIYFYRLDTGERQFSRKMVLVK